MGIFKVLLDADCTGGPLSSTDADEQDLNLSAIAAASPLSGSCHGNHGLTPMLGSLLENLQLKSFFYIQVSMVAVSFQSNRRV